MIRSGGLWAAVVVCGCAGSALGQIHLTQDTRLISASASASNAGGTVNSGPTVKTPAAFGAAFNDSALANAVRIGASAGASVTQISEIGSGSITGQGSFSTSTLVTTGLNASASVSNVLELAFRLDGGATWEMQGSSIEGAGFRLIAPDGSILLQDLGFASGVADTSGWYRIIAGGSGTASQPGDDATFGGAYSFVFTAVPTPGTVGVMGVMMGILGGRRR